MPAPDVALRRILQVVGARALNTFGRQVLSATVLWELYERTHDNLTIAFVGIVQVIPVIALFVPSGGIVDKHDRRTIATLAALATGAIGVALCLASALHAPVEVYFVILLAMGAVTSVYAPAAGSLVPMMIPREDLGRANRVGSSLSELAAIGGPSLAGLALIVLMPAVLYAVVGAIGLGVAVLYQQLPKVPVAPAPKGPAGDRSDWRVGLRYIFRSKLLLPALTLDMFAVLFAGATALLPAIATDVLDAGPFGYGMLRAAESVGGVLMAVIGGRIGPWKRPGRVLLFVVAGFALVTIGFGMSRWLPLSFALLVCAGALDNVSVVIRLTLEQMVVPDHIRGRVGAVHYVFIGMSNELGAGESGLAAWVFGTVPAIVGGGVVALAVVGVVAVAFRSLAKMPPLGELTPEHNEAG